MLMIRSRMSYSMHTNSHPEHWKAYLLMHTPAGEAKRNTTVQTGACARSSVDVQPAAMPSRKLGEDGLEKGREWGVLSRCCASGRIRNCFRLHANVHDLLLVLTRCCE